MTFLQSILLGLIQGVAEFLPISSSDTAAPPPYFCRLSPIRCTRAAPWGVLMMP